MARHTFGTHIASLSNDTLLIKSVMGHADIKTSMQYIHLSNKMIDDKLKNIDWNK